MQKCNEAKRKTGLVQSLGDNSWLNRPQCWILLSEKQ